MKITDMTRKQLLKEGFGQWDESGLLLIPLSKYALVPSGTVLTCINGKTYVKGKDRIDDDTRGGLMAYGWIPR